jgi:hypothetical protein
LNRCELKVYSQNGEDGIIMEVFSIIGATNRIAVEFGVGDGRECNSANLLLNLGWNGLLMDADGENVRRALQYYSEIIRKGRDVKIAKCRVKAENTNAVLRGAGISGEIDLLSLYGLGEDVLLSVLIGGHNAVAKRIPGLKAGNIR